MLHLVPGFSIDSPETVPKFGKKVLVNLTLPWRECWTQDAPQK
jgi:hypothetical protein